MELVRSLLKVIRESDKPMQIGTNVLPALDGGWTEDMIIEHVRLVHDKGLVEGLPAHSMGGSYHWLDLKLSWEGHDFIELAESDSVWRRAVNFITGKGVGLTIEILKPALTKAATDYLFGA